jgi:AcrR family transcriptional regulator
MTQMASEPRPTRRERQRQATLQEIVEAANEQLRLVGPQGLTLSAVARELGMTAPALYRYVDGVDGLITLLIADGYSDLAEQLETAAGSRGADDPGGRFLQVAEAGRDWARNDPARWGLLFGSPLPGYAAPEDGPTEVLARRAAGVFWQLIADADAAGLLGPPLVAEVDPATLPLLEADTPLNAQVPLSTATQAATWAAISLLLGAIAVEVFKHMPQCDEPTARAVFRSKVLVAMRIVGLPDPRVAT